MKAEYLMIGDWVKYITVTHDVDFIEDLIIDKGQSVTEHIIKIASTDESGVFFKSKFDESFIFVSMKDVEPIPLTEEILEKNGFLQDSNQIFYLKENIKFGIKKDIDYGYWFTNRADNYKEYICTCDFVHELQHILKLCKIEKEIVI